jgi:hypothetical protein
MSVLEQALAVLNFLAVVQSVTTELGRRAEVVVCLGAFRTRAAVTCVDAI